MRLQPIRGQTMPVRPSRTKNGWPAAVSEVLTHPHDHEWKPKESGIVVVRQGDTEVGVLQCRACGALTFDKQPKFRYEKEESA